ncbi:MAG: hypothetical protein QF793_03260 [Candidatus Peribacteraceae bacterium]|jgi:hypothetical protein|nr:hypothetical protein [Candidatus Peribacteraceae bacterium]|tara:strand:+ start:3152 stop:3493 length:342 start_codon:yes stop_codon:yes gene_type:complete
MAIELTVTQRELAEKLAEHAKDACKLVGISCKKAEPQHFSLIVHRYYGRVQGMTAELDRCIEWCVSRGKMQFTAQRFGKWCANKVKWDKEEELKDQTKKKDDPLAHVSIERER